ncbi:MAG TPA: hypothetical protein VHU91_07250 [Mycobacteriales bacterium]|nr:hypothetical protein [Mycobacteriales bacterium]
MLRHSTGGNFVIVASQQPLPTAALAARLSEWSPPLSLAWGDTRLQKMIGEARILTDYRAPIDQLLTNS